VALQRSADERLAVYLDLGGKCRKHDWQKEKEKFIEKRIIFLSIEDGNRKNSSNFVCIGNSLTNAFYFPMNQEKFLIVNKIYAKHGFTYSL
jgi:hypothetical protein